MAEKDYAPLSSACVRALHDKLYDKRKAAALEIEKMVKEFAGVNNKAQIKRLLKVLGEDFALSQNPHARKGGLIGLAAIAIALGKESSNYIEDLVRPILGCLSDQDLRVRYYACESLYNVVKVSRGAALTHFSAIFNALSKVATDPDQQVKNASELLDRLLKDIVTESSSFDLEGFMPLLRERIYTKAPFARQFVISWISILDMVPDINLISYLPEILDGLFTILGDTNLEVKKMCETTLSEFLRTIKSDPSRVHFSEMINILISHAQDKNDDLVQFIAITWIKEFVQLSGPAMLPHMAGIFKAILPCLSYDTDVRRNIKETASAVNFTLMKLISLHRNHEYARENTEADISARLDLPSVIDVLGQHISHNSIQTKVAVLKWIHELHTELPDDMLNHLDVLFPVLQQTLSDDAEQVVQQCLVVIAQISTYSEKFSTDENKSYYDKFLVGILHSFQKDKRLLDQRGSFIIRQLCVLLNAEDIYRSLAGILLKETDLSFIRLMVEHLNMILLTSSELYDMRSRLKELDSEANCSLFVCLYETWSYNPVATVALCLLTQNYGHVCELISLFGNLEVTVDLLLETDKLVQLIESPIFAYLRLELLHVPCDKNLVRALYGLLMLLPQTESFHMLKTRMSCIPSLHSYSDTQNTKTDVLPRTSIQFEHLLQHFIATQNRYKEYKKNARAKEISLNDKDTFSGDL